MKISDKDLDNLFHQKLNHAEEVPDDFVWDDIARQLGNQRQNNRFLPYLSIAATILLMIAIGFWLLKGQKQVVRHQNEIVKNRAQLQPLPQVKTTPTVKPAAKLLLSAKNNKPGQKQHKIKIETKEKMLPVKDTNAELLASAKTEDDTDGNLQQNQLPVLQLPSLKSALAPDASVSLKTDGQQAINFKKEKTNAVFAADITAKQKHKRIRNMGDLVNLVVGRVDKRSDKIIEFTDRDGGDEAELTGINLGFISLKKEK